MFNPEKPVLFFYSSNKEDNPYNCFSNFFRRVDSLNDMNVSDAVLFRDHEGRPYWTSEQYFMTQKAKAHLSLNPVNQAILAMMYQKSSFKGKDVKKLGRDLKNFDPKTWGSDPNNSAPRDAMAQACLFKFGQNPDLHKILDSTGDRLLVEASPYDKVWGIGLSCEDAVGSDPKTWGQNWLGEVLMWVREVLRNDDPSVEIPKPWSK